MCQPQTYCSICGAPMLESSSWQDHKEWLTHAILLTTGHTTEGGVELDEYSPPSPRTAYSFSLGHHPPEEDQRSVLRLKASSDDTSSFTILKSGKRVEVMCVAIQRRTPSRDHGAPLFLPVHPLCLQLADRFIDSMETSLLMAQVIPPDGITSVKNLWEVLHRRLPATSTCFPAWALPEPHEYFGGRRCRNVYWAPGDDPEHAELHEQNPVEILGLTESILQNLEPTTSIILNGTVNHYVSHQNWYCEALINGQMFPWLWDLDINMVRKKQHDGHWNWELLVRKLSLKKIHEPDDRSIKLPLQLRNRRRIWRLFEEARVHDVAGLEEELMAARVSIEKQLSVPLFSYPTGLTPQEFPGFDSFKLPQR